MRFTRCAAAVPNADAPPAMTMSAVPAATCDPHPLISPPRTQENASLDVPASAIAELHASSNTCVAAHSGTCQSPARCQFQNEHRVARVDNSSSLWAVALTTAVVTGRSAGHQSRLADLVAVVVGDAHAYDVFAVGRQGCGVVQALSPVAGDRRLGEVALVVGFDALQREDHEHCLRQAGASSSTGCQWACTD